jgi:hypothetical protein
VYIVTEGRHHDFASMTTVRAWQPLDAAVLRALILHHLRSCSSDMCTWAVQFMDGPEVQLSHVASNGWLV